MEFIAPKTKICITCKQEKPIEDFYKKKTHRSYRMSFCTTCDAARLNKWSNIPENRDKIRLRQHETNKKLKVEVLHNYSKGTLCCVE